MQVCCGTYGCCSSNLCINNATTNNQPFCCEASSPPCPGTTGLQFGLNCCQKGTTCLNSTTVRNEQSTINGRCLQRHHRDAHLENRLVWEFTYKQEFLQT